MQPIVVAALAVPVLLVASLTVPAAMRLGDLRRARRPLPRHPRLARLALALNAERSATRAQGEVAQLRRRLFDSCRTACSVVAAHDDPHAGWLLAQALRLAGRLDDELRALWPVAGADPALLERAAVRIAGARGLLDRLCEAVCIRAGEHVDEVLDDLAHGIETERVVRLRVAASLVARPVAVERPRSPA
jgi:hypothetical protein